MAGCRQDLVRQTCIGVLTTSTNRYILYIQLLGLEQPVPFQVDEFIWQDEIVDKVIDKHQVYPDEVEECFFASRYKVVGPRDGKYLLYSRSTEGRYLLVVFAWVG